MNLKHAAYLDFESARKFVMSLRLKTTKDWARYCLGDLPQKGQKPKNIPPNPHEVYRYEGWKSWTHWLGANRITNFYKIKSHVKPPPEI